MANEIPLTIVVDTKNATASIKSFSGSAIGAFGKASIAITGLNQSFELLGKGFDLVSGAFDRIATPALEFQDSIAEITTLIDESEASTEQLGKTVLKLQKDFGGNATVKAKAFYNAISSGAVTAANAQGFLSQANKLAVGGITDLNTAVDGLTTVINAFGLETEDTTEINDSLFIAMKKGKTTIDELSRGISVAAASAGTLGVDYKELLAATSALTTGGLSTNVAFTQIRATMSALSKPTTDLQKILDKLNITSIKAQIEQDGLVGTLNKLIAETDGSAEAINKLFGSVEAVGAVSSLTSSTIGNTFNAALKEMGVAAENSGATTEEAFNKIASTTSFKIKRLKGTVEAGFTDIGNSILKRMGGAVDFTSERFDKLLSGLARGIDVFFNEIGKTEKSFDFGKGIDAGIKIILKGFKATISILTKTSKAVGEVFKAVVKLSNLDSPLDIFDDALISILVTWKGMKKSIIEVDKAMNDFWGQNEEQAANQQKAIDEITSEIDDLYNLVRQPIVVDVESEETIKEIDSIIESIENIGEAGEKAFDEVQKSFDKPIESKVSVKTEKEDLKFDVDPTVDFVGPLQQDDGLIDTDKISDAFSTGGNEAAKALVSALPAIADAGKAAINAEELQKAFDEQQLVLGKEEKNLEKARNDLRNATTDYQKNIAQINLDEAEKSFDRQQQIQDQLSKSLDKAQDDREKAAQKSANAFGKAAATGIATAFGGPIAGQIAGPIFDILSAGPEAIRAGFDAFADALPELIEVLAESAPVLIEALAENADKIILALAQPDIWFKAALAVAEAIILILPGKLASAAGQIIDEAFRAIDLGIQDILGGIAIGLGAAGRSLESSFDKVASFFTSFGNDLGILFSNIFEPFQGIADAFNSLIDKINNVLSGDVFSDAGEKASGFLEDTFGVKLATGGEVPSGFPNDTFAARLTSGENVVDVSTNKKLNNFLDNQQNGSGNTDALLGQILTVLQSDNKEIRTTIELEGEALETAIFNLNQRNARLA